MSEAQHFMALKAALGKVEYKPNFRFQLHGGPLAYRLTIAFDRPDTRTGIMGTGTMEHTVSKDITESGLVQMVFGKLLDIEEHECREAFKWSRERVFGPHNDLEELWKAAQRSRVARGESQ